MIPQLTKNTAVLTRLHEITPVVSVPSWRARRTAQFIRTVEKYDATWNTYICASGDEWEQPDDE